MVAATVFAAFVLFLSDGEPTLQEPDPPPPLTIQPTNELTPVRVVDRRTGEPLAGAEVTVGTVGSTPTDADGIATLAAAAITGTTPVTISRVGYVTFEGFGNPSGVYGVRPLETEEFVKAFVFTEGDGFWVGHMKCPRAAGAWLEITASAGANGDQAVRVALANQAILGQVTVGPRAGAAQIRVSTCSPGQYPGYLAYGGASDVNGIIDSGALCVMPGETLTDAVMLHELIHAVRGMGHNVVEPSALMASGGWATELSDLERFGLSLCKDEGPIVYPDRAYGR